MELLDLQTDEGFASAKALYENGAFSKTVSDLTVSGGLAVDIPKGTKLTGFSASTADEDASLQQASPVDVYAVEEAAAGSTSLRVQYVNEGCYVGANPDPVTIGCKFFSFEAENGRANNLYSGLHRLSNSPRQKTGSYLP